MSRHDVLKFQQNVDVPTSLTVAQSITHKTESIMHSGVRRTWEKRREEIANPAFAKKHTFRLNNTEGIVSDYRLEFTVTDGGTTVTADQQAPNFIEQIRILLDGREVDCYPGEILPIMQRHLNDEDEKFNETYALSGGDGNDLSATIVISTKIHAPGSDLREGTTDHPLYLELLSNEMTVEITLRASASAYTTVGGSTITCMALVYKSWLVDEPAPTSNLIPHAYIRNDNLGSGTEGTVVAYTADTLGTALNLDAIFTDHEVHELMVALVTDGADATRDRVQTVALSKVLLKINSKTIYEHNTTEEGRGAFYDLYGHTNTRTINSTVTHYYSIPIGNHNPKAMHMTKNEVQEHGINADNAKVRLQVAPTTTDSFVYNIFTLSRRVIRISRGRVEELFR